MKRFCLLVAACGSATAIGLGTLPAQAHGLVNGGPLAGLLHPLFGADHLLMLLAVGTAASQLSLQLLLWALAGGVIGVLASAGAWTMPFLEILAALAIVAVAALPLTCGRRQLTERPIQRLMGGLVGTGVALHSLSHGLEAHAAGGGMLWWAGALFSSAVLCGGSALLLRRVPQTWARAGALGMVVAGAVLAFAG